MNEIILDFPLALISSIVLWKLLSDASLNHTARILDSNYAYLFDLLTYLDVSQIQFKPVIAFLSDIWAFTIAYLTLWL